MLEMLLTVHVTLGAFGLLLGPVAMFSKKKFGVHTKAGTLYHWVVFLVCSLALILSIKHWDRSWYLFFVAIFTYSFAFRGFRAAKKRKPGWLKVHVTGMLGSYVAMVTALLVISQSRIPILNELHPLVAWLTPSLIGVPLIRMVRHRLPNL